MPPFPWGGVQSAGAVGVRRGGALFVLSALLAVAAWSSCSSPEAFRGGSSSLSTGGSGGTGGTVNQAGAPGNDASAAAGDGGAAGTNGAAGDNGAAGANGAAGTIGGIAGAGGAAGGAGAGGSAAGAGGSGSAGAAGSGAAGSGPADAGSPGAAGTGGAGTAGAGGSGPPASLLSLPVTVSDHFAPTGGMGDARVAGAVTIGTDATACAADPAAADKGACYTITYLPPPLVAATTWAGFYWQYPDNNWGAMQPHVIATGAKDISFYAKGKAGGESITFQAGGIMNQVSAATPYTDSFNVRMTFSLTTTWTKYTLPLTGVSYGGGVLGAFSWVAEVPNTSPVTFYLHGVVWE